MHVVVYSAALSPQLNWQVEDCCLVAKSRLTLSYPIDCSPLVSSVHGILQARILEWVAMSSSRGSSWSRDQTRITCLAGGFFTTEPPGKPMKWYGPACNLWYIICTSDSCQNKPPNSLLINIYKNQEIILIEICLTIPARHIPWKLFISDRFCSLATLLICFLFLVIMVELMQSTSSLDFARSSGNHSWTRWTSGVPSTHTAFTWRFAGLCFLNRYKTVAESLTFGNRRSWFESCPNPGHSPCHLCDCCSLFDLSKNPFPHL